MIVGVAHGTDVVASLLLMDDIVLATDSPGQLQEMLDVMDSFGHEWHLTYSEIKTKAMVVNQSCHGPHWWKLGQLTVEETDAYTYLGEKIARSQALAPHINLLEQKMYAHTNRILAAGSSEVLSRIKMETIIELHNRCLVPALLYNCETWTPTKKDEKKIDTLQVKALRKYLKTPKSTPKLAFYADMGIYPLRAQVHQRQLLYLRKLICTSGRAADALYTETQEAHHNSWYSYVNALLGKYSLPLDWEQIGQHTKGEWETAVKKAVVKVHNTEIFTEATGFSKLTGIFQNKQVPTLEKYMVALSRKQASAIFRLRCKSTRVEFMRRDTTPVPICPMCNDGLASDVHLFTVCPAVAEKRAIHGITGIDEIFSPDPDLEILRSYADFALDIGIVIKV